MNTQPPTDLGDAVLAWLQQHETLRTGAGIWLGLFVAALLLLQVGTPPTAVVLSMVLVATTLLLSLRWRVGWLAIAVLLVVGIMLRQPSPTGAVSSDVLTVTRAAIEQWMAGGNPYGHGFDQSTPPGSPFAYGPLALVWYLPFVDHPTQLELLIAWSLVLLFAVRGRVLGLAVYATLPALVLTSSDGSNDTSAGLILLVALLLSERAPRAGAVGLAVAVAFKPYALAWLPPLLAYGGVIPLVTFAAGSMLLWGPAMVAFGPRNILWSLQQADSIHGSAYYSFAFGVGSNFVLPKPLYEMLRFGAGICVAASSWVLVRSARSFIVTGIAIYFVTLYLGWWSTVAYVAAVAPIVCWHLDDWLTLPRVKWPADPVGAVTSWVDARYPIVRPWTDRADGGDPDPGLST
jgi:hypothetical protein